METVITWALAHYGPVGLIFVGLIFYIRELKKDIQSILSDLRDERSYNRELNALLRSGTAKMLETLNAIERAFERR